MHKYIIDIVAIVVALFALFFSIWQGKEQIKHNHVSVEPRINSYLSINDKNKQWGIYLINNGMGTAFVSDLKVLVDGKEIEDSDWGKFYSALLALKLSPACFTVGGPRVNDSFKVGEEQLLVEAANENSATPKSCPYEHLLLVKYQKDRLDYILKFKSIYEDEFSYQYSKNVQNEI